MALDGDGGEAVGHHQGHITGCLRSAGTQSIRTRGGQPAPPVGMLQVIVPVDGLAFHRQAFESECIEAPGQGIDIQGQANGVPGPGMGQLERQMGPGGKAAAGAAQGDARTGVGLEPGPGIAGQPGGALIHGPPPRRRAGGCHPAAAARPDGSTGGCPLRKCAYRSAIVRIPAPAAAPVPAE
ncbi:hypothetical protein DESC_720469 [Desulfosarcina cetonica]|nr:hypothetical protein DESC_720469 [Desulfosarcina cetonica]